MKKLWILFFLVLFLFLNSNIYKKETLNLISVHLLEANLIDAIRLISSYSDKNIIVDGNIKEKVTLVLKNITADEALNSIVESFGYSLIKRGNIYHIVSTKNLNKEMVLKRKIFSLEYASAPDIKPILQDFLSKDGKLISDDLHNSLIVVDYENKIKEIEKYLYHLDIPVPQVAIEAKIVETVIGQGNEGSVSWELIRNYSGIKDKEKRLSFNGEGAVYGVISSENLEIILNKLITDTKSELLSCPNVTTLNNETAVIEISTNKVVGKEALYDAEGKLRGYTPRTAEVGIRLEVTPLITKNNYINLKVSPSISSSKASALFPDEALDITESKANTSILIKDGETLIIGGLIKTEERRNTKKVPILSDIPYIGRKLFTTHEYVMVKKELTIFIKAKILRLKPLEIGFKKYY